MKVLVIDMTKSAILNPVESIKISTRPERRKAVYQIRKLLAAIVAEESAYLERMPENFRGADAAELSIDCISDAIISLQEAY